MYQFILCIILVIASSAAYADPTQIPLKIPPVNQIYSLNQMPDDLPAPHLDPGDELTEQGYNIRGVYLPYPKVISWKSSKLVRWVKTIGANAVIMDVKDDRGRITISRKIKYAHGYPHGAASNMKKHVEALHKAGIYTIARVVCFKDNQLARVQPKSAIRDHRDGKIWRDRSNLAWVDPHSTVARDHITRVAIAAENLGFDEVQLDYVRFPVERNAKFARYPNRQGKPKRHVVIARLLAQVDAALNIPLSIDVFGLTAYNPGDKDGLGQSLEHLAPYIDAISPMVYLANWPRKYWEKPKPSKTHALVSGAVKNIRRRLGEKIAVRPLLQGFKWRAENFGASFIKNQINAAETGGSSGHLFWNQNGNYTKVSVVWQRMDNK